MTVPLGKLVLKLKVGLLKSATWVIVAVGVTVADVVAVEVTVEVDVPVGVAVYVCVTVGVAV